MRYYIDTEFIEGFHKPLLGKRRHFIDLISIGIVAEDGREYYAISNEFNPDNADEWVKENVLYPIIRDSGMYNSNLYNLHGIASYNKAAIKHIQKAKGKPNDEIAKDIKAFVYSAPMRNGVDFYAYYADYDWVLFCSLFGRMIDLPEGFPMYCRDLKQYIDSLADELQIDVEVIKSDPNYPKLKNEHSALDDARWNKSLHEFLISAK